MERLPLSICIPTHNRAKILGRTLEHLGALRELFSEVVVSDNASVDDTPAVVEHWRPRLEPLRYHRQPENRGPLRNLLASLSLARADFAYLLCDDDQLIAGSVFEGMRTIASDPACVAVYGGYEQWDAGLQSYLGSMLPPNPGRFTRSDWLDVAANTYQLTFPIVRRTTFQRHCFFDETTFGLWRLLGQLLNQGAVHVIPHPLYRHAETPARMEQQAHEAWYHDFLRSDWELFIASMGSLNASTLAEFVMRRTVPVYMNGVDHARERDLPLLELGFLARLLAYDRGPEENAKVAAKATEWVSTRLIAAVIAQLTEHLIADAGLRRIVVEIGPMNIKGMLDAIVAKLPGVEIVPLALEQLSAVRPETGDLVLTENWETLASIADRQGWSPAGHVAVGDIIKRLRPRTLPPTPVLYGPGGTAHFSAV
jgi:glycosyltransferase involved in cell wall biosynthesis